MGRDDSASSTPFRKFGGRGLRSSQHMRFNLLAENRDLSTGAAATLIWGNLARQISCPQTPPNSIAPDIPPVYGIVWKREATKLETAPRILDVLWKLRNPPLPRTDYGRLSSTLKNAIAASGESPPKLLECKAPAGRFLVDSTIDGAGYHL